MQLKLGNDKGQMLNSETNICINDINYCKLLQSLTNMRNFPNIFVALKPSMWYRTKNVNLCVCHILCVTYSQHSSDFTKSPRFFTSVDSHSLSWTVRSTQWPAKLSLIWEILKPSKLNRILCNHVWCVDCCMFFKVQNIQLVSIHVLLCEVHARICLFIQYFLNLYSVILSCIR